MQEVDSQNLESIEAKVLSQNDDALTSTDNLPAASADSIKEIAEKINFDDPALTLSFGAKPMNTIAQFADGLLQNVRAKDAGPTGDILTNLLLEVKSVDVDKFGESPSFLSKIPVIGSLFNSMEKNLAQFQKVSDQVQNITGQLDKAMVGLLHDIEVLEQLFISNKQNYTELTAYIAAGKQKLEEARSGELVKLQEAAAKSQDGMDAQKVRDFADRLNRFEKRISDLEISRTVTLQTVPQIRLIQSNNQTLAEKIQTSILTTIPIWKNQIVLALSLNKQRKAVELQKQVSDATNEMLLKNADMLQQNTIATAKEAERSVVDIETIRTVHTKLLSTLEETLNIATEGRVKRASIEKELQGMEADLRNRLVELAAKKTQDILSSPEQLAANAGSVPKVEA